MSFVADLRFAFRSFTRAKGLALTVIVTLALGIGANAAIFSVVRSVLLRPLVNRDADRLLYVRQTARGIGTENLTFSVPEINDLTSGVTTITAFGDFSTVEFTLIGFGREPRVVTAGVVNGSFFEVMGLRPVLGRLLNAADDGPGAAAAAVLTHHFWTAVLDSDSRARGHGGLERALARGWAGRGGVRAARLRPTAPIIRSAGRLGAGWRQRAADARHEPPSADLCDDSDRVFLPAACRSRDAGRHAHGIADSEHRL